MLLGAGSLNARLPMRHRGGASISGLRSVWSRGDRFNQSVGEGITSKLAGVPSGHLAPSSWLLPYKAGAISSRNDSPTKITVNNLNLAKGVNLTPPTIQCSITVNGNASSVASLIGSATASLTAAGSLSAPFNMTASALMSSSASGVLTAVASLNGSASSSIVANMITGAIAHLIAVPISQELTADQIAVAVWSANAIANDTSGTMGEKLNDAGSGANPWNEVIESGFTAGEILRLIAAVSAGDGESLNGITTKFKSLDGTKDRVIATVTGGNRDVTTLDVTS